MRGANISEKTLLSTDYLNHFNEIVMLIEMVPDMPDMIEDCRLWHPKSYQQHFRDSGFSEKELAIEAYDHVPEQVPDTCSRRRSHRWTQSSFSRWTAWKP